MKHRASRCSVLRSAGCWSRGRARLTGGFFTGAGLFVSVFLVFAAVLAWQLGGMPREVLRAMPLIRWGLALCFVALTYLSWQYFFIVPVAFSGVIAICLLAAAWLVARVGRLAP